MSYSTVFTSEETDATLRGKAKIMITSIFREDRSSVTDDSEVAIKVSATVIKVLATVACVALGAAVTMLCVQPAPACHTQTDSDSGP